MKIVYISVIFIYTIIMLFFLFLAISGVVFDLKLLLYAFTMFVCLIIFWTLPFAKIKKLQKVIIFAIIFIFANCIFIFSTPMGFLSLNSCVDTNICQEEIKRKNVNGKIFAINKQNCIENDYKWIEEDKSCIIRD